MLRSRPEILEQSLAKYNPDDHALVERSRYSVGVGPKALSSAILTLMQFTTISIHHFRLMSARIGIMRMGGYGRTLSRILAMRHLPAQTGL
jgi:hypothetical protein